MLAGMIHLMRGTPYIYQGEEIGMLNAHYQSIEKYRDVESLNYYQILLKEGKTNDEALEILAARSRDNSRTPMQWNSEEYGGFSDTKPWLPMSAKFSDRITVEAEENDQDSILAFYKKLIKLRKDNQIISDGDIFFHDTMNDMVMAYVRSLGKHQIMVFCNMSGEKQQICISNGWENGRIFLENYTDSDIRIAEEYTMKPYELLVLEKE